MSVKVYVLVRDETDYDGEREIMGVYASREKAQVYADWEREKAEDWVASMRETGENVVGNWVPRMSVIEAEFIEGDV